MLPDLNAENDNEDQAYEEVNYGRLVGIYYVEFIEDLEYVSHFSNCQLYTNYNKALIAGSRI